MEVLAGTLTWMNSFPLLREPRLGDETRGLGAQARPGQAGRFHWPGRRGTDPRRTIRQLARRSDEPALEYGAGAGELAAAARAQGRAARHRERVRTLDRPRIQAPAPWVFPWPAAFPWAA